MRVPRTSSPALGTAIAVVVLATATYGLDRQTSPGATGVVAGQVTDGPSRRPLAGAVVTMSVVTAPAAAPPAAGAAPRPRAVSAVANGDGRFVFRDVPPGSYSLTSTLENHTAGAFGRRRPAGPSSTLVVAAGDRLTNVGIAMWRLAAISGVITDDRGEPVIGAYITAMRRNPKGGRFEIDFEGGSGNASDDRGYYRISGLMPGSYVVTVRNTIQSVSIATLDRFHAATIEGTASTREWPYSGVLQMANAGLVVDGWQIGRSSGELSALPGPDGTLLVHPPMFYPRTMGAGDAMVLTLGAGDERVGIDLSWPLVRGMRVSGTLRGPNGPAAWHGLSLVPVSTGDVVFDIPVAYSTSDPVGRFSFFGVTPGAYLVRAYRVMPTGPTFAFTPAPPGAPQGDRVETVPPPTDPWPSLYAELPISVGSSHVEGLEVELRPGARVGGRIEFEGAAPPPAEIQRMSVALAPLNGRLPEVSIRPAPGAAVNAAGRFHTGEYPPGRYHLNVNAAPAGWTIASIRLGDDAAAGQAFALGGGDVNDAIVTFTDKKMMLSGTVRARDPGGDGESTILVIPRDIDAWIASGASPRRTATTNAPASGAYQLQVLLPGEYVVVALPPEVITSLEPEFLKRAVVHGVGISVVPGENKTLSLTIANWK